MKKWLILSIVFGVIFVSAGERATLFLYEDYLIENKNVTLMRSNSKDDVAIFCVNGEKGIVREGSAKNINSVYIEVDRTMSDSVNIELDYSCKSNCMCGNECDNSICFGDIESIDVNDDGEISDEEEIIFMNGKESNKQEYTYDEDLIEPEEGGTEGIIVAVLIVLVLLLGIIVLWRRS